MSKQYHVSSCGKLYIAGEYAILKPAQVAIIKNIPINMFADISFSDAYLLSSDLFSYQVSLDVEDEAYHFLQTAIHIMNDYLRELSITPRPFRLRINSHMGEDGKKFGIGSSGSLLVLVIKAFSSLYKLSLTSDTIFKLASYILLKVGDNGSMGDVACISYDTCVFYRSFDRNKIRQKIETDTMLSVLNDDWGYIIHPVKNQLNTTFLVGWTQKPAISSKLVSNVEDSIDQAFLSESFENVLNLLYAIEEGNKLSFLQAITKLANLIENLHPDIYNKELLQLRNDCIGLEAIGKSSGAGGGDCGIAFCFSKEAEQELIKRWDYHNIKLIYKENLHDKS